MRPEAMPATTQRTQPPSTRLEYAQRYAALGFTVFPLHWIGADRRCSCEDADCRSPGKHPLVLRGVDEASRDPLVIEAWFTRWPDANIGMAMGARSGVFAVDVDPRNGGDVTLAERVAKHGRLPDTINALTGGGGFHYLFRWDGRRVPGKLGKGIDIKGEGGYIVVEPSMHASGVAYAWEAEGDPIYGAQAAAAPAWIFEDSPAAAATGAATVAGVGHLAPERILALRSALAYLDADDRDVWIRVGMALKSTSAPQAYGVWTEWSQQSEKFDPAGQRKTWNTFKPESLNVESIFSWATDAGWVNPASTTASRFSAEVQRAIESASAPAPRLELVEDKPAPAERPFPTRPLCEVYEWMERQSPIACRAMTQQSVLSLVATCAGRQYVSDDSDPCHLYLGIVADSIDYARHTGDIVKRVLADAGLRRLIRGTRLGSASAIYSAILRYPSSLHVSDEWGHLIAFARRQPSGAIDQAMGLITSLYSAPTLHIDNPADAGIKAGALDDQLVVYHPALSLLALMSADQMAPMMRRGEVGRGALSQMLSVLIDAADMRERRPESGPSPQWLRDQVCAVRRVPVASGDRSMQEIFGSNAGMRPSLIRVRSRVDLDEAFAHLDDIGAQDMQLRTFTLGARRIARRIAVGLAAWSDPGQPEISPEIADWAGAYVGHHMRAWVERYSTLSSDDGRASVMQQVLELIGRAKTAGISQRQLIHGCWGYRNLKREARDELIGTLLADESIYQLPTPNGQGKVLVAARFVKQGEALRTLNTSLNTSNDGNALKSNDFFSRC